MIYQNLFSKNPYQTIQTLELLEVVFKGKIFDDELIGILVWLHHHWLPFPTQNPHYTRHIQAMELEWLCPYNAPEEEKEAHKIIVEKTKNMLNIYFSDIKLTEILRAGAIFRLIFPNKIPIGNADTAGYEEDCVIHWQYFEPYKTYFEAILGKYEFFDNTWITLAQVLWGHYRWGKDDSFDGVFCVEASAYFLQKAVYLSPKIPIHYYNILSQRQIYSSDSSEILQPEKRLKINNPQSLTYFYYAQYLQYYGNEWDKEAKNKSISFYKRFLENEPHFFPFNDFPLFSADAKERMYAPSSQEALQEIGMIFFENKEEEKAIFYLQKSIGIRPNNYQTPYWLLAKIYKKQGNTKLYLEILEKQIQVLGIGNIPKEDIPDFYKKMPYVLQYNPNATQGYNLGNSFNPYARINVYFLHDFLKEVADTYLFELTDLEKAKAFYKKLLHLLQNDRYVRSLERLRLYNERHNTQFHFSSTIFPKMITEILENQIRIAFDKKDYWQVRNLCEKLEKQTPKNIFAPLYLKKIKGILGY